MKLVILVSPIGDIPAIQLDGPTGTPASSRVQRDTGFRPYRLLENPAGGYLAVEDRPDEPIESELITSGYYLLDNFPMPEFQVSKVMRVQRPATSVVVEPSDEDREKAKALIQKLREFVDGATDTPYYNGLAISKEDSSYYPYISLASIQSERSLAFNFGSDREAPIELYMPTMLLELSKAITRTRLAKEVLVREGA